MEVQTVRPHLPTKWGYALYLPIEFGPEEEAAYRLGGVQALPLPPPVERHHGRIR